ncbi:MAG: acyl-CoA dehydrogenase family protein [Parvularculaceae bacterium]
MNFDFNDDQVFFRDMVRKFLDGEYPTERHVQRFEGVGDPLWSKLADLGVASMLVDEAFGGQGMSFIDSALVIEEFGRALVPIGDVETLVCSSLISRFGSAVQKSRWLAPISAGTLRCAVAISEDEAGYALSEIAARASRNDHGWYLHGRKILVPDAADADLIVAVAQINTGTEPIVILLDRSQLKAPARRHVMLDPAVNAAELDLTGVKILEGDILGGEGALPGAAAWLFDACAAAFALYLAGAAGKVLDQAVDYAGQRVQFSRPIGSFQAIKHKCADMAVSLEASRSAAYYAAWSMATDAPDRAKAVSMAKAYCGDAAAKICNDGIQIHGGMGFTWELGLHYYLRRVKFLEYAFGDAAFHRERVLAASLAELGVGN